MKTEHLQILKESVNFLSTGVQNKEKTYELIVNDGRRKSVEIVNREKFLEFSMEVVIEDLNRLIEEAEEV